jgi:hypothetical protein
VSTTRPDTPQCAGIRKDGSRCGARIVLASGFCLQHDAASTDIRDAAHRAGGRGTSSMRRAARTLPGPLATVLDRLTRALDETHSGAITPAQATGMAALARAIVAVVTAGEMEDRLRALEAQIGGRAA